MDMDNRSHDQEGRAENRDHEERHVRNSVLSCLLVLLVSTVVTIATALTMYGIFLGRNTIDIGDGNKNQSLQLNIFFIACDAILILLCLLELVAVGEVLILKCGFPKALFLPNREKEMPFRHIRIPRVGAFVRYSVVHCMVLAVAVAVDLLVESDIWADLPLIGIGLLQLLNGALLYLMKAIVKNIRNHMGGSKGHPQKAYWCYYSGFLVSSIVELVFCPMLYIFFLQRDAKDMNDGNRIQSESKNIEFIALDSILLVLAFFQFLLLVLLSWIHLQSNPFKELPEGISSAPAVRVLWLVGGVSCLHLLLLTAVVVMDAAVNFADLLSDLPLWALVFTNICYLFSLYFTWRIMWKVGELQQASPFRF